MQDTFKGLVLDEMSVFLLDKEKTMNTQLTRYKPELLNRAMVGFDSLFGDLEATFGHDAVGSNYPPYNLVKADADSYELEIAVTGFAPDELTVEINNRQLVITGQKDRNDTKVEFLHRGLAARNFTRVWLLAEHMEVGTARIKNGVLTIPLNRVIPEELKPRKITLIAE